jgi:hypothetical protein
MVMDVQNPWFRAATVNSPNVGGGGGNTPPPVTTTPPPNTSGHGNTTTTPNLLPGAGSTRNYNAPIGSVRTGSTSSGTAPTTWDTKLRAYINDPSSGQGAATGVMFPNWGANFGTPSAAVNTPAAARLAMSNRSEDSAALLQMLGGNEAAMHQMNNAYQVGGQNYKPWLNQLVTLGINEPTSGAMAQQWAAEGLGYIGPDGKWVWADGKGWE